MTSLKELTPPPARPEARLWYGYFAEDVPNFVTPAKIILPEFDSEQVWGPARWMSRDASTLPNEGDECLVAMDNRMNVWVINWWHGGVPTPPDIAPGDITPGLAGQYLQTIAGAAAWGSPGPFTDAQLASPNNAAYRLVHQAQGNLITQATGTWLVAEDGTVSLIGGIPGQQRVPILDIQSGYYGVAGKTTNMSLRAVLATNATAPTSSFFFRLYPLTSVAGGAGVVTYAVGASVASVSAIAPAASSIITRQTADFALPADGQYVLGLDITGANMVANSAASLFMQLLVHYT